MTKIAIFGSAANRTLSAFFLAVGFFIWYGIMINRLEKLQACTPEAGGEWCVF